MVTVTDTGGCMFRLYMPHAGSVELLGSFCNWRAEEADGAVALTRDDEGWWTAGLELPPGDHEFCYLVDGRMWMPDYAAGGVRRDSSGRWVSMISVPEGVPAAAGMERSRPIGAFAEPRMVRTDEPRSMREFVGA